ncbi:AAA family ATPase [Falsiroseomonas sp. E2-1-a20]|uniref:AAA family ATPase n=1 Tax=Falsiroseomonas sp. E2-1-a20 TaxID=3239300 RepID=UPI003F2BE15A
MRTQQVFKLEGPAGPGKTEVARHIVDAVGAEGPAILAYAGKAASVWRQRGGLAATTIHERRNSSAGTPSGPYYASGEAPLSVE